MIFRFKILLEEIHTKYKINMAKKQNDLENWSIKIPNKSPCYPTHTK